MKNPWFLPAAALIIGASGGFIAGKGTAPEQKTVLQDASGPASADSARANAGNRARSTEDIYRTPGASKRLQALLEFYSGLTPAQLEAEAASLENLPMTERLLSSFLLFSRWGESDPLAAMAHASKMGMAGMLARPTILQSWASTDPEGAAQYYLKNPREFDMMPGMMGGRGMGMSSGASTIASEWARLDPDAAMAWARSLSGNDKNSAMAGVVGQLGATDPAKAWSLASEMEGTAQANTYRDLARIWGSSDYAEAERMVATLPADQQAAARAAALEGFAQTNPTEALAKAATLPAGETRNSATRTGLDYLSRTDAAGAANWIVNNSDEDAKIRNIEVIMPNYVNQDPNGALAFVQNLTPGEERDAGLSSYVFNNRTAEPTARIAVAETIDDPDSRDRAIFMTTMGWMREDPTAANAYIQSSPTFSDEQKQRAAEGQPLFGGGGPGGRGPGGFGGPGGGGRR